MSTAIDSAPPPRIFRLAQLGGAAIVVVLLVQTLASWHLVDALIERGQRLQAAASEVLLLDQVLTMAANLYAATGRAQWSEGYAQASARLSRILEQAETLAEGTAARRALADLARANRAFMELEHRAQALVDAGHAREAQALLATPTYAQEQRAHADNLRALVADIDRVRHAIPDSLGDIMRLSLLWASGGVLGLLLMFARLGRMTLRYREESAAAHAEARKLALIAEETDNAVIVTDAEDRIEWVNAGFTRITGYTAEEARGQHPGRLLQGERTDPATVARIGAALRAGQTAHEEIVNYAKDGREYWIEMSIQPIRDTDGTVVQFVAIESEITGRKAAEHALRRMIDFQEQLLDSIPNPVFHKDADGTFRGCNRAFEAFVGRRREEIVGHSTAEVVPANLVDRVLEEEAALIARGGGTFCYEASRADAAGTGREIIVYKATFGDESNAVAGFVGSLVDITAAKRYQQQLADEKALLRALIDTIPDLIFFKDTESRYLGSNKAFAALVGRADEPIGLSDLDLFDRPTAEFFRTVDREMLASGVPRTNEEWVTHPDGRQVLLETLKTPFHDSHGRLLGLIGIARDITERWRIQTALREQEAQTRAVVEHVADGIVTIDATGTIVAFNKAAQRIFGYTPEEILGQSLDLLTTLPRAGGHRRHIAAYLRSGSSHVFDVLREVEAARKDGTTFPMEVAVTQFRIGERRFFIAVARDVTERKRALQELSEAKDSAEAANRSKSAFLAAMSHEIRTPMNGIVGMAEVLRASGLVGEQQHMLETIRHSALALRNIIDDILDFSKIEAGHLEIEEVAFSLPEIFEEVAETLSPLADRKALAFVLDIDPELAAPLLGDPTRLRQVLFNLGSNAIKFTANAPERRGRVLMAAQALGAVPPNGVRVSLRVRDNGIGIAPEHLDKLFRPFVQAETSTTRRFGGTGLGLAICRQLVELMGGDIQVHSAPGAGTELTVALTLQRPAEAEPPRLDSLTGVRVLLLDPDPEAARSLARQIARRGGQALVCTSVRQALALVEREAAAERCLQVVVTGADSDGKALDGLADTLRGRSACAGTRFVWLAPRSLPAPEIDVADTLLLPANPVLPSRLLAALLVAAGRASPATRAHVEDPRPVARRVPSLEEAEAAGRLILVAEDNEINRDVIRRQLKLLGYAAEIADDGAAALALWGRRRYGLLLTDCHMPEMDGYALTEAIRQAEGFTGQRLPIVAFTANALKGEAERCLRAGMDDYLAKPVELAQLQAALAQWLPLGRAEGVAAASAAGETPGEREPAPPPRGPIDPDALRRLLGPDVRSIRRFLTQFVPHSRPILAELERALGAGEAASVREQAHKLKSSARAVGALELSALCQKLEEAGAAGDLERIARLHAQVAAAMEEVAAYVRALPERVAPV